MEGDSTRWCFGVYLLHTCCESFPLPIAITNCDESLPLYGPLEEFPVLMVHPGQPAATVEQGLLNLQLAAYGGRQLY